MRPTLAVIAILGLLLLSFVAGRINAVDTPNAPSAPHENAVGVTLPVRASRPDRPRDRPDAASAHLDLDEVVRDLLATALGPIRGRVVDRSGTAVASVQLHLKSQTVNGTVYEYRTATSAGGEFALEEVRYPLNYEVRLDRPEAGVRATDHILVARFDQAFDLVVEPKVIVTVRVADSESGLPLAGATCVVLPSSRTDRSVSAFRAKASAEGVAEFVLARDEATAPLRVAAQADGHEMAFGEITSTTDVAVAGVVRLRPCAFVRGTVVAPDGAPLADVQVSITSTQSLSVSEQRGPESELAGVFGVWGVSVASGIQGTTTEYQTVTTVTDGAGVYTLTPLLPAKRVTVVVRPVRGPPTVHRIDGDQLPARGAVALDPIVLRADAPAHRVRFRTADGLPVKYAAITFQAEDVPQMLQVNSLQLQTDANGECQCDFIEPGERYTVYVRAPGLRVNLSGVVVGPAGEVTVVTCKDESMDR